MSYHVGDCPSCRGTGQAPVPGASTGIAWPSNCELCGGMGIVRVAVKDIALVRQREDGEWERADAVSQLGSVADDAG